MHAICRRALLVVLVSIFSIPAHVVSMQGETVGPAGQATPPPQGLVPSVMQNAVMPTITRMADGRVSLGKIVIDKKDGTVSVKGAVNMQKGLVEYLACTPYGKLHESVLQLDVDPYYLQIALLLVGLKPGDNPISQQGAKETPQGAPVRLWVSWQDGKKIIRHRAENLLFNKAANSPVKKAGWVFTGSFFDQGRFLARVEGSLVAVYHDPTALFDNTMPEGSNDELFFVNSVLVPAKGTPVTFIIEKTQP